MAATSSPPVRHAIAQHGPPSMGRFTAGSIGSISANSSSVRSLAYRVPKR
jgi:hypothetical protein